ncbi:unnamed protein product [Arctogadus glacialis]
MFVFPIAFQKFGISLSQLPDAKLFDDSKTEVDHEVFEEVIGANTGVYELSIDGVSEEYPRFKDVKGLIEQDFVELFGEATSNTFKERWPTAFKDKIIAKVRDYTAQLSSKNSLMLLNHLTMSIVIVKIWDGTVTCLESSSSCIYFHLQHRVASDLARWRRLKQRSFS